MLWQVLTANCITMVFGLKVYTSCCVITSPGVVKRHQIILKLLSLRLWQRAGVPYKSERWIFPSVLLTESCPQCFWNVPSSHSFWPFDKYNLSGFRWENFFCRCAYKVTLVDVHVLSAIIKVYYKTPCSNQPAELDGSFSRNPLDICRQDCAAWADPSHGPLSPTWVKVPAPWCTWCTPVSIPK